MRAGACVMVLVCTLGACSSSSKPSAASAVQSAIRATIAAGSLTETIDAIEPTASGHDHATASGGYSFSTSSGSFTITVPQVPGPVVTVVQGATAYIHLPAPISALLPAGKPYVSVDLGHPPTLPELGGLALLAGVTDPSRFLNGMSDGLTSATASGSTYTVHVDLTKPTSALGTSEHALLGAASAVDTVTVGTDGRISRVVAAVAISAKTTATLTVTYAAFGAPVSVKHPPASQVVPATQVLGS